MENMITQPADGNGNGTPAWYSDVRTWLLFYEAGRADGRAAALEEQAALRGLPPCADGAR